MPNKQHLDLNTVPVVFDEKFYSPSSKNKKVSKTHLNKSDKLINDHNLDNFRRNNIDKMTTNYKYNNSAGQHVHNAYNGNPQNGPPQNPNHPNYNYNNSNYHNPTRSRKTTKRSNVKMKPFSSGHKALFITLIISYLISIFVQILSLVYFFIVKYYVVFIATLCSFLYSCVVTTSISYVWLKVDAGDYFSMRLKIYQIFWLVFRACSVLRAGKKLNRIYKNENSSNNQTQLNSIAQQIETEKTTLELEKNDVSLLSLIYTFSNVAFNLVLNSSTILILLYYSPKLEEQTNYLNMWVCGSFLFNDTCSVDPPVRIKPITVTSILTGFYTIYLFINLCSYWHALVWSCNTQVKDEKTKILRRQTTRKNNIKTVLLGLSAFCYCVSRFFALSILEISGWKWYWIVLGYLGHWLVMFIYIVATKEQTFMGDSEKRFSFYELFFKLQIANIYNYLYVGISKDKKTTIFELIVFYTITGLENFFITKTVNQTEIVPFCENFSSDVRDDHIACLKEFNRYAIICWIAFALGVFVTLLYYAYYMPRGSETEEKKKLLANGNNYSSMELSDGVDREPCSSKNSGRPGPVQQNYAQHIPGNTRNQQPQGPSNRAGTYAIMEVNHVPGPAGPAGGQNPARNFNSKYAMSSNVNYDPDRDVKDWILHQAQNTNYMPDAQNKNRNYGPDHTFSYNKETQLNTLQKDKFLEPSHAVNLNDTMGGVSTLGFKDFHSLGRSNRPPTAVMRRKDSYRRHTSASSEMKSEKRERRVKRKQDKNEQRDPKQKHKQIEMKSVDEFSDPVGTPGKVKKTYVKQEKTNRTKYKDTYA